MKYKLNEQLRKDLKVPMGLVTKQVPFDGRLITVGDVCSADALRLGRTPVLMIYDKREKRMPAKEEDIALIEKTGSRAIHVKNRAGEITQEADDAIKLALGTDDNWRILVDGEEDLLVLPCIKHAENGVKVGYGQPDEGVVILTVDDKLKGKIEQMLDEMKVVE